MTAHGWQEDEKGLLEDAGTVGGDAQVGPAHSRRFWAAATELFELVEVYGYAARDGEDAPVVVQLQWGYSICSDRNDPGMTEQWADYLYEDVGLPEQAEARAGYANAVEHATGYAREVLTRLTAEDFAAKAEEICRRAAMSRPGRTSPSTAAPPVRGCPRPQLLPGTRACWRASPRPNGSLPLACEICQSRSNPATQARI